MSSRWTTEEWRAADAPSASELARLRVGVIGHGNMGGALAEGFVASGEVSSDHLLVYDRSDEAVSRSRGRVCGSLDELASEVDVAIIAVKPYAVAEVAAQLVGASRSPAVIVSIAAGVSVAQLRAAAGGAPSWCVRTMPNTAASVGVSTTAVIAESGAPARVGQVVRWLFGTVGRVVQLGDEGLMHAFTAVAGSGPAFAYVFAEALADGGVAEGLSRPDARRIAASMLAGAAALLLDVDSDGNLPVPGALKDAVASPSGTTIAGLAALEAAGLRAAAISAVQAAAARSRALEGGS